MILSLLGGALLLLLVVDVFSTVFSPFGRGGPVNRWQNRFLWRAFRRLGRRRDGSARDGFLSLGGPVIVVVTLAGWMFWLVTGFAMIFYPSVESFLFSPGSLRSPLLESFYFSAYTAATLGFGDMVPDTMPARLAATLEALGGFALLSVSVTYFLAVYRELVSMNSTAASIASYLAVAGDLLRERQSPAQLASVDRWCESTAAGLTSTLMAHFQYPVLHYFRALRPSRSLPVQIGSLLELRACVRAAADGHPLAELENLPFWRVLNARLEEYVDEVETLFVPRGLDADHEGANDPTMRAHRRTLEFMVDR